MSSIEAKWSNVKNLFALIIGIDNYPHVSKLRGAVSDADRFESFLRGQVKVEDTRIINLRNDEATREKIEDAFCSLWKQDSIKYDDPIVIYYAGHGCKILRPAGWEVGGQDEIEGIFPYDIQPVQPPETNTRIYPIPDRTIGTWLNILSFKKGNNITVIFDCCHSASGARGEELTRAVTFSGSLPDDIDKEYYNFFHETVSPKFPNQHLLSHVFLAACGADESAVEVNNKGKFTTELLDALGTDDVDKCTYAQFMGRLRPIPGQTPQCDSHLKNRILFSNTLMLGWGVFPVSRTKDNSNEEIYRIDAGFIHGVHKNTLFNMYKSAAIDSESNHPICELRAARIYPLSTEATMTERHDGGLVAESGFARQKCSGKALIVHFTPALRAVLKGGIGRPDIALCVKKDEKDADFFVNIDGENGVSYLNIILRIKEVERDADFVVDFDGEKGAMFTTSLSAVANHGFTRFPEAVPAEPEPIIDVLCAMSQWTQHLDLTESSWIENIEIEFCSLEKVTDVAGVPVIQRKGEVPPIKENAVSITVLPENDDMYGMVIRNKTNLDLHVSILVFDIDSLEIESHFSGALGVEGKGNADPSLRKGKDLTIGYGNGGAMPFMFNSPENGVNVTILKLYFTSIPMDFGWLKQTSPFLRVGDRGARRPEQVKQFMASQAPVGATTLFTIVQRASPS